MWVTPSLITIEKGMVRNANSLIVAPLVTVANFPDDSRIIEEPE